MNFIDLHCDTIWRLMEDVHGANIKKNAYGVDLEKMRRAGTLAQFFACFVDIRRFGQTGENPFEKGYAYALEMIGRMQKELEDNQEELRLARTMNDLQTNREAGVMSALLTIEEGGILNGHMERMDALYKEGIRLITLLWNVENCIGYPNSRERSVMERGLKPFGKEVVLRMHEMGMVVDVSHLSDGGFWEVLELSTKPVVASHSNARSLCPHPRNLTDEMIRSLARQGGIAGLNLYPYFLNGTDNAGVLELLWHVQHMMRVGGEDFVAIGTDFDGFEDATTQLRHLGEMKLLRDALACAGLTERQIDKIWYGNAMRVLGECL